VGPPAQRAKPADRDCAFGQATPAEPCGHDASSSDESQLLLSY
jgi:hypothetical protein